MRRNRVLLALLFLPVLAMTTCCSVRSVAGLGEASTKWRDELLAAAPVANPADIPKGTTMWAAHKRGTLVYGGSKSQKLFSIRNPFTGQLEGFDATLAMLLAKYLTGAPNVDTKIVTSETREALLENRTIDSVFYTYSISPEREKKVDFAGPYFISGESIGVQPKTRDVHRLADLAGQKVCVTKGGTGYQTMTSEVPRADLVTLESSTECEKMLEEGRVYAQVQDRAILLGQAAKGNVRVVGGRLTYEPYGIGLPKGSPKAVAFVNDWLKTLIRKGIWRKAYDHTVGRVPGEQVQLPEPGKNTQPKLRGRQG